MAAPKGNKYAEKWTEEEAVKFVTDVEEYIRENEDCVFIGEAVTDCGYYRELWNYISTKYADHKVFHTIRVIEGILENRLYKKGLTKEYSGRLVEFGLKNNHQWKDRKELEHSGYIEDEAPTNLQELYDAERTTDTQP